MSDKESAFNGLTGPDFDKIRALASPEHFPYYLRNITVGIIHNATVMQFNCDGTHIVSADDYQDFSMKICETSACSF